jgi:phosphoribosylglycinamide formyltransferase 1
MHAPCPIVVLISGNGSNLQALIDSQQSLGFRIAGVVCNVPDAFGLQRAEKAGIPTVVLSHRDFPSRESYDQQLIAHIDTFAPKLVVLAGYMRILSSGFVNHYAGRVLNIHPSLLPDYRGTNTHQRVLDAGEKLHGVSIHFVTEELDGGPVILQTALPVTSADTRESLAHRVAVEEHRMYPEVVGWFCNDRLKVIDDTIWLDNQPLPAGGIRRTVMPQSE